MLVSGTILLFIRDWRTTVIATLAIPTSIIPTFLFMDVMGFTLNNITMLGLILAIGIVIDDAVVVHENIFRHMEEDGMDGMTASRLGTREIALPVLRDEPRPDRHLPADRLHRRDHRPVLRQLRLRRRLRGGDEPVRLLHPDADALQPLPQAGGRRGRRRTPSRSPASSTGSSTAATAGSSGGRCRHKGGDRRRWRSARSARRCPSAWRPASRLIPRDDQSEYEVVVTDARGLHPGADRPPDAGPGGPAPDPARTRRTSSRRSARCRPASR